MLIERNRFSSENHSRSYGMAAADLYEPPPPTYQTTQAASNNFAGEFHSLIIKLIFVDL